MNEFTWTTRDGREIPLSKIGNAHLFNIEQMMRRQIYHALKCSLTLQGEMALDAIHIEITGMEHDHDIICTEMRKRGLISEIWREENEK